jgi:hypothetical protein
MEPNPDQLWNPNLQPFYPWLNTLPYQRPVDSAPPMQNPALNGPVAGQFGH